MSENFIIKKKCNFTQINNNIIRSKDLSFKAKGLLEIFLSFSDEFDVTLQYIADNYTKESIDTVRSAMKELRSAGYAKSEKVYNGCLLAGWRHTIYDSPQLPTGEIPLSPTGQNPLSETATNPTGEIPLSDNHYNKILNKNNIKTKQKDSEEPAKQVLDHYCKVSGKTVRAVESWLKLISTRLNNYTPDELMQAVSITLANKFLCGENPDGKFVATLDFIFRSDKQVDKILMQSTKSNSQPQLQLYSADDFAAMTQDEFKDLIIKTFPNKYNIGAAIKAIKESGEEITRTGIWNWHLENGVL